MTKELMELADEYAVLRLLTHEDTSRARAALQSAIESLQVENERLKQEMNQPVMLSEWQKLTAERDALAAKLAILTEARACEIFSMGEWCLWPLDRYEEAKERGWQVRKLVIEPALPIKTQLDDDKERLDFVEKNAASMTLSWNRKSKWSYRPTFTSYPYDCFPTARQAIDAAKGGHQ